MEGAMKGGGDSCCHRQTYLQFVDQHGDGVELIDGGVRRVSHGGRLVHRERKGAVAAEKFEGRDVVVLFWRMRAEFLKRRSAGQGGWIACGAVRDVMQCGKQVLQ